LLPFAEEFIPARLAPLILASADVGFEIVASKLDRKSRNRLVETIKSWLVGRVRDVPIEKGEVVAGGVALEEVESKSMASKLIRDLYLCGEI
ncbi:NAD(P)/FAD-dependent oxidoreductase, partial [Acinetobacter baumannii]